MRAALGVLAAAVTAALAGPSPQSVCQVRGPTPPGPAVTSSERAAVPLASSGHAVVTIARARTVLVIDLATGEQTRLAAGIADPHEVAVSPDGRWAVAADFGDYIGDYAFTGHRLAVFDLRVKRLARVIDISPSRGPHDVVFASPTRLFVTTQTTRTAEADVVTGQVLGTTNTGGRGSHTMAIAAHDRAGRGRRHTQPAGTDCRTGRSRCGEDTTRPSDCPHSHARRRSTRNS